MKKSLFILAVVFATTLANAQITLEHTFNRGDLFLPNPVSEESIDEGLIIQRVILEKDVEIYYVYDAYTYDFIVEIPAPKYYEVYYISRGFFTDDETITYFVGDASSNGSDHLFIANTTGDIIYDFGTCLLGGGRIFKVGDTYKLAVVKTIDYDDYNSSVTEIYSLPGKGIMTDVDETPAPSRNARKYLHNDQVLIDSNESTYNMQGQHIR